jgi:hypothetical protein
MNAVRGIGGFTGLGCSGLMLLTVPCCSQNAKADEPCERTIIQLPRCGQSNFKESAAASDEPRHYFFAWSLPRNR